jgi:hypothetical protein
LIIQWVQNSRERKHIDITFKETIHHKIRSNSNMTRINL